MPTAMKLVVKLVIGPGQVLQCMLSLTLHQHFRCFAHEVDNEQVCVVFHP